MKALIYDIVTDFVYLLYVYNIINSSALIQ